MPKSVGILSGKELPTEFAMLFDDRMVPWEEIIERVRKQRKQGMNSFEVFTDVVIDLATKESMKEKPNPSILVLGLHACLVRGRLAEALFLSTDSEDIRVLSLRAIVLFVLSDINELKNVVNVIESKVSETSPAVDQVRLSTARVLFAAVEQDTSVIVCIMEFDNLLEENPEQVEEPLVETMFTLYVVGTLLFQIGQASRASRVADTLEKMAKTQKHKMFKALVENLKGHICNLQGNFSKAEKHYLRLQRISTEMSFELGIAMALNNLGTLRINSLRFEDALQLFQKSYEMMKVESTKIISLANLGEISSILNRYKEAEGYLKEGIRLERKTQRGIIEVYTWYAIILSRTGRLKEAKEYLMIAEELAHSGEKPLQKGAFLFAMGIYEFESNRFDNAIQTFEELLSLAKENEAFEYLIRAELELASTYVKAFMQSESTEHFSKAAYHLNDLITLSDEQGLQALLCEALLIRSDMFSIAEQRAKARSDLDRVMSIASFIDDSRLKTKAKSKIKILASDEAAVLKLERADLTKSLNRLTGFKPVVERPKEVPSPDLHSLIVIDRGSGLPVFVYHFDATLQMDSSIFGGFLSAITAFSDELLGDKALLRSITHEGFTVLMEYTSERIITLIADQETFDIRFTLRTFRDRFNQTYPSLTDHRGVDTKEFRGAELLVKKTFSGTGLTQEK